MRLNLLLVLIIATLASSVAHGQRWKRYRHEAWGGIGATNFLGELGGGNQEAQDLFLDFDAKAMRFAFSGGYRYKLNEIMSLRGGLTYARIYGSDEFSGDPHRRSRNLSFRSPLVELSAIGEVFFIREKTSNRYRVRGIRGALGSGMSAYVFGGLAGVWFNPRAEFNGQWYNLHALKTEGQGLTATRIDPLTGAAETITGPDPYRRITMALPFGIGAKYSVNRNISISFEYGFRLTFTDYMDDVSGRYFDPIAIADANGGLGTNDGDAAFFLSNPAIPVEKDDGVEFLAGGPQPWTTREQRGDATTNDAYMFAVLAFNYKFTSRKTNRPKF
jgi:opacity protein-like surface antigen